jgi:hypothetical protein
MSQRAFPELTGPIEPTGWFEFTCIRAPDRWQPTGDHLANAREKGRRESPIVRSDRNFDVLAFLYWDLRDSISAPSGNWLRNRDHGVSDCDTLCVRQCAIKPHYFLSTSKRHQHGDVNINQHMGIGGP